MSEWIQAGVATILAVAAWIVPLARQRRLNISLLALFALLGVAIARASVYFLGPVSASIFRDWMPVAITLVPYWQTGQFFIRPNEKIQAWLVASERRVSSVFSRTGWKVGYAAHLSMEWAYSFCYPIVPLGLAVLYFAGVRQYADTYWLLVLAPTYLCYAITPFFPAFPPRSLDNSPAPTPPRTKSRIFNLWLSKHGSIQAISFPSAHVASALGASLVLLHYAPVAGMIFLAISFWIAVGAVAGGYHYTIDVVLGAVVPLVVYFAWRAQ